MAIQYSTPVRNARLDVIEATVGTSAQLIFYSGTKPTNPGTALSGNTVLATMLLPSDWMAAASGGTKALLGTWQDASADATGTLSFFRIFDSAGTTCHVQGTVTATGGGGDITVSSTSITSGQPFSITSFTLTEGNP